MSSQNNLFRQRKQSQYEREVSRILYKMVQEDNLPSLSVSYCLLSSREENLKIYLTFSHRENPAELLELINKNYSPLIKVALAKSKKFAYLPRLLFFSDERWTRMEKLEKIINNR